MLTARGDFSASNFTSLGVGGGMSCQVDRTQMDVNCQGGCDDAGKCDPRKSLLFHTPLRYTRADEAD
jgi:hypothetical protein